MLQSILYMVSLRILSDFSKAPARECRTMLCVKLQSRPTLALLVLEVLLIVVQLVLQVLVVITGSATGTTGTSSASSSTCTTCDDVLVLLLVLVVLLRTASEVWLITPASASTAVQNFGASS